MKEITLQRPEGERHYLHFPAVGESVGAMVFLAGTGSTAAWAAEETRLPEAATAAGFHVIVPEAQRPRPEEPARFLSNPPRWNDGSPAPTPELQSATDDVGFLTAVIDDLYVRGLIEEPRVHLCGFSNGAGMAFRYASEFAERVIALAPVAGLWWPTGPVPSQPMPTQYVLGLADPLIPWRGGEVHLPWGHRLVKRPAALATLEAWAAALGCESRSVIEHDGAIRVQLFPGPVEFRATLLAGLGHHWPGGRGQLNPRIAGPLIATINLSERLVEFFKYHVKLCQSGSVLEAR